jgi:hypothetical protein
MPAAGSSYAGAVHLNFGEVGTYDSSIFPQAFYMTPTVTGSYKFEVDHVSGPNGGYVDVYRLTEGSLGAFNYNTWVGWCGDSFSTFAAHEESWVELIAGQTYVIDCYDIEFDQNGTYTTQVTYVGGPSNDRVVNAKVISAAKSGQWIAGTTLESSEEEYEFEFDNILGNQQGSVWYKVVHGGPGYFSYGIRSKTPGWHPQLTVYHGPGVNGAGTVNSTADLDRDISSNHVGNGTEEPPYKQYDVTGTPGSTAGDLAPIEGGETFYLQVTGYENEDASYKGDFEIFATLAPPAFCLDAIDYINPSSTTATVVSGSVRETQQWENDLVDPFESRYGDGVPTLIIPGDDILAATGGGTGFYAVSAKTKNDTSGGGFLCGMIRNGQPLHPGAWVESTTGATLVLGWLTAHAGAALNGVDKPTSLNTVWYLPCQAGDVIEFVFSHSSSPPKSIDISQICFQKIKNAKEGVPYDMIDIPHYPLGTDTTDVASLNPEQAGDLIPYKGVAPTYYQHNIDGHDMCVTDDGVIWIVTNLIASTVSGTRWIGPYLMKYDPSSPGWTMVNDDIEGLGVKRTTRGVTSQSGPYRISMDTDGEDIWVCYGVDNGAFVGGGRNTRVRVKKYDVSANSWSNVGSPFCGPDHGGATVLDPGFARAENAGGFGECATIRVSPSGKPWVAFTDEAREPGTTPPGEYFYLFAYVAEWTGSTWNIHRLDPPDFAGTPIIYTFEAETYIHASGTTSSVTEDGEGAVRDTQTAATADSMRIIPPAGAWMFGLRVTYNRPSGNGGIAIKFYKNGVPITVQAQDAGLVGATNPAYLWLSQSINTSNYQTFNGTTDELEIRIWRQGTATEVFADKIRMFDAYSFIQQFDVNAEYVDDGQPQVALWMRQPNDPPGLSENPSALVVWDINRPELEDTESEYYIPPGQRIADYATTDFRNAYYEWNGSSFELVWDKLTEEDVPDHVFLVTREDNVASTPPYGHFQQGMAFCSGPKGAETDNYISLCLGGGQGFGFFGDSIIATKVTDEGLEAFTTVSPTVVAGAGITSEFVLGLAGFSGWAWDIGGRAIHCDANGDVWLHWAMSGPDDDALDFVAVAYKHNQGDNGLGGWFAASEVNEQMGWDAINDATGRIESSPSGDKIYLLQDTFIFRWTSATYTYGVWECPVLPNHKIPLIPILGGKAIRVYPDGRIEIINAPQKRVIVSPSGDVTVTSGEAKRVAVESDGSVRVLGT